MKIKNKRLDGHTDKKGKHAGLPLLVNNVNKRGLVPWQGHLMACAEGADGKIELCISVEGKWKVRPKQVVNSQRHAEMVAVFNAEGRPLLFDYDHMNLFTGESRAAGWGTNMRVVGDKLYVDFEGTPEGINAIKNGEYKYLSPVYQFAYEDSVTGKKINSWRMHSVALTNTPFITELPEIAKNNEDVTGGNMDPEVLAKLEETLGVKGEAAVNAKLAEMRELNANNDRLTQENKAAQTQLNTQTVEMAIANKQLLPAHKEYALQLINTDKELYGKFVETVKNSVFDLTREIEVNANADGDLNAPVKGFAELLSNTKKAKNMYVNNRKMFDELYAQHVTPGDEYQVNTAAGFGQKLFVAKVHDLEVASKSIERELLDTIHDRTSEARGSEESMEIPRFTPGNVVDCPATAETFVNGSTEDMLSIPLSDKKGYPIIVTNAEQLETNIALRDTRAEGGRIAHRKYRNGYIAKAIANAAAAGNRLKFADTTDNLPSDADIINASIVLNNAEAPFENRFMAIGASMYAGIAKNPNFLSRDKMGDSGKLLPENVIGKVRGFEVVLMPDGRMPLLNASSGATGTTGKKCVLFYQKYAVAYGAHVYELLGPESDVAIPATKYNLFRKQGCAGQNTEFIVTYREN